MCKTKKLVNKGKYKIIAQEIKWKVENLGVWHVSVDTIPRFICRVFNQSQNMLLCCTVSQAASISLWLKQVTEIREVTMLLDYYADSVLCNKIHKALSA